MNYKVKLTESYKLVIMFFLVWRIWILVFGILGIFLFSNQKNFIGGGLDNYLRAPWFWAWSNFDGEHYVSIAQEGYDLNEQAFFPVYPLLIGFTGLFLGKDLFGLSLGGLLISNISFLLALIGLYKLIRLDFSDKISLLTIALLLLFPASFYFGSVYTESLFLALTVWSIYLARKRKWLLSGILGGVASGTRIIGIILLPVLAYEFWVSRRERKTLLSFLPLLLVPVGLFSYIFYLWATSGDPFYFIHSLPSFGEQRSSSPILLPQVFYRYIFRILPSVNWNYLPIVFSTLFEFLVAVSFSMLCLLAIPKLRTSYLIFLFAGFLLPTFSGSFSSLPRYILVLFPAFLLFSLYLHKNNIIQRLIFLLLLVLLFIFSSLFFGGYWVS